MCGFSQEWKSERLTADGETSRMVRTNVKTLTEIGLRTDELIILSCGICVQLTLNCQKQKAMTFWVDVFFSMLWIPDSNTLPLFTMNSRSVSYNDDPKSNCLRDGRDLCQCDFYCWAPKFRKKVLTLIIYYTFHVASLRCVDSMLNGWQWLKQRRNCFL